MNKFLKIVLPLIVLCLGAVTFAVLSAGASKSLRKQGVSKGPLVKVINASISNDTVYVKGYGTARALKASELSAQVNGEVVYVNEKFKEGGYVSAGEILFSLEKKDYELSLTAAKAELAKAEEALEIVRSDAKIATKEWKALVSSMSTGNVTSEEENLIFRKPQLKSALTRVEAARASVEVARLNLERCEIKAPYDGFIKNKKLDLGQYIRVATPVASIIGTEAIEIIVPLSNEDVLWITSGSGNLSDHVVPVNERQGDRFFLDLPASVSVDAGKKRIVFSGKVSRVLGAVDERSRTHNLSIMVDDPYQLRESDDKNALSLSVGMFAEVSINVGKFKDIVRIPVNSLRADSTVWVVENGKIRFQKVDILKVQGKNAYITSGLKGDEKLVLSNLSTVVDGMKVRFLGE